MSDAAIFGTDHYRLQDDTVLFRANDESSCGLKSSLQNYPDFNSSHRMNKNLLRTRIMDKHLITIRPYFIYSMAELHWEYSIILLHSRQDLYHSIIVRT